MKNSKRYKRSAIISFISLLIILITVNLIFSYIYFRIDLTKDKRNSLAKSTIELLRKLDDRVYIKVYIKGDKHPADYQMFAEKAKDILQEFRRYSKYIYFDFIDPVAKKSKDESNSIFLDFYKKGLYPIPISREDASGFSTHYIVPGAMLTYKTKDAPVSLIVSDPNGADWLEYSIQELEYNLVATIRQLMTFKRAKVAFIEGHGELDLLSTSWMVYQLQRFYKVERARINGKINSLKNIAIEDSTQQTIKSLGNKYDVLIIAQPTEPFSEEDRFVIDQHIMRGGKVLWLIDATTASIDSLQNSQEFFAIERNLQLNKLFFNYGVRFHACLIQDLNCLSLPLPAGYVGDKPQYKFWAFPYIVNITNFSTHPIVRKMKSIKGDFVGIIDFVNEKNSDLKKTTLMTSSARTKLVPTPSIVTLNVVKAKPNMEEFMLRYLPIAVLVEGKFTSAYDGRLPIEFDTIKQFDFIRESPETRQIFVADGDIIRNYFDRKNNQPYPAGYDYYTGKNYDNSDFILNCVNYLCADNDLLHVRAKSFKIGTLNQQKIKEKSTYYAVVNISVPLLLIFTMGGILIVLRKRKYTKKHDV